jgi:hypothetical protein
MINVIQSDRKQSRYIDSAGSRFFLPTSLRSKRLFVSLSESWIYLIFLSDLIILCHHGFENADLDSFNFGNFVFLL